MIYYIQFAIGDYIVDRFRFKNLGSKGHEKALAKAIEAFEQLLGEDMLDEVAQYLTLQSKGTRS